MLFRSGLLCAVIVAITVLSRRGFLPPLDQRVAINGFVCLIGAALATGSGVIHLAVVPDHLAQWWVFGVAFAVAAVVQIGWAGAYLARPNGWSSRFGIALNVGIIAVWVISRTAGLPVGPTAGRPDPIGFVDVVSTLLEVILVGILIVGIVPRAATHLARERIRFGDASIGSTFSVLVIAIACAVAITGFAGSAST